MEFTPAMVKAAYDNLYSESPKNQFVVGINDDELFLSLPYDEHFVLKEEGMNEAMFYGKGADGTGVEGVQVSR
ncbi:hypothetical protein ACYULU_07615 [Breznakiellaceae bacterium SP9]